MKLDKKQNRLRRALIACAKIDELAVNRLSVHRTPRHIYAQIIAPDGGTVLASASSGEKDLRKGTKSTGNVAAALISCLRHGMQSPVKLLTRSNEYLSIYFKRKDNAFSDVYLEGDARVIYTGELNPEAWQ